MSREPWQDFCRPISDRGDEAYSGHWNERSLCLSELWPAAWDAKPGDPVPLYRELRPLGEQSPQFRAVLVCERCPVRLQCLDDAMSKDERHGIRGALMPSQRKALALMLSSVQAS